MRRDRALQRVETHYSRRPRRDWSFVIHSSSGARCATFGCPSGRHYASNASNGSTHGQPHRAHCLSHYLPHRNIYSYYHTSSCTSSHAYPTEPPYGRACANCLFRPSCDAHCLCSHHSDRTHACLGWIVPLRRRSDAANLRSPICLLWLFRPRSPRLALPRPTDD